MERDGNTGDDPGKQLQPGWWRTGDGWQLALETDGTDGLAKPLVIIAVVVLFLVAAYVLDWKANSLLALWLRE